MRLYTILLPPFTLAASSALARSLNSDSRPWSSRSSLSRRQGPPPVGAFGPQPVGPGALFKEVQWSEGHMDWKSGNTITPYRVEDNHKKPEKGRGEKEKEKHEEKQGQASDEEQQDEKNKD